MIRAVLFDMDGVLYHTMPSHAKAWLGSMAKCGLSMSEEEVYRYEGMIGTETIRLMARQQWGREVTTNEANEMYSIKSAAFAALPPSSKMSGIDALITHLHSDCGLTIGVVTGSGQRTLTDHIASDFSYAITQEHIVTAYDVKRGKPAPDPYLSGLAKCGVKANEAIVVENAPLGVQAARAADIFTVAVNTGPLPDSALLEAGADIVVSDMHELLKRWEEITNMAQTIQ
ncbi:MAG: HAD family phosphatase [Prevotella sp.]|nr:HAD family phosphatase [Prevotella sp.]